jgi:uncharacterized membrane protein YfbV (UPF0208 family)
MKLTFTTLVQDGYHYMKVWPKQKVLNPLFAEGRVIAATKLAMKTMPPMAVLACAALLQANGSSYLPQALAVGAFFLSLPLQGVMWLGHRSNQLLPPYLRRWYREVHAKLQAHGCKVDAAKTYPKYRELAKLLKTAFSEMDRAFTQQML